MRRPRGGENDRGFIAPCLAIAVSRPPDGAEWATEIKYDGYRIQAHVAAGTVRLLTRSGLDWTEKLGRVTEELAALHVSSAILDCEAIVQDVRGRPDFHALRREIKKGPAARIALMAFDLLELDGRDMRGCHLLERKRELRRLLEAGPPNGLLRFSDHVTGRAEEMLQSACAHSLEGIVCKRLDRPYRSGRSGDWVKVKCTTVETLVVAGYVPQKGTEEAIGSLSLGFFRDGKLQYAGRVGTGFTADEAHQIWRALQEVRRPISPFDSALDREQSAGAVWVEPRLVVEITHAGWTPDDVLRHSVFKRFCLDRQAADVGPPSSLRPSD
ncbi:MAG: non-homologous end-joining DNA ligase [Hyphomicrobiaceae bacterium]